MEDYTPASDEAEQISVVREHWLPGNFAKYWLERLRSDDEDEEDSEDRPKKKKNVKKEIESVRESNEESRSERWLGKLRKTFGNWLGFELMPVAQAAEQSQTISGQPETNTEVPVEPAEEDRSKLPNDEDQGVLAVSADAQRRYYDYEAEDPDNEETEPEVEIDDVETEEPIEHYYVPSAEAAHASQPPEEQRSSTTEPVGDVLQRRQTERLEKKVKKLKKRTKSLKHEQEDMAKKQKDFAKELEDQQKAQDRFEKVTVPKMERDRQELRKRLEKTSDTNPKVKHEVLEPTAVMAETVQGKTEVKSEYVPSIERPESRPQADSKPAEKEKLDRLLEVPTEEPSFNETIFERRHEVKDQPGLDQRDNHSMAVGSSPDRQTPVVPPPFMPPPPGGSIPPIPTAPLPPPQEPPKPADSLYKQAALAGAVSGVGLTIIAILIILLMRY